MYSRRANRGERYMNPADLRACLQNLEALARGFVREASRWEGAIPEQERRAYVVAVLDVLAAAEQARAALDNLRRRK
jgi:hypothetical protein